VPESRQLRPARGNPGPRQLLQPPPRSRVSRTIAAGPLLFLRRRAPDDRRGEEPDAGAIDAPRPCSAGSPPRTALPGIAPLSGPRRWPSARRPRQRRDERGAVHPDRDPEVQHGHCQVDGVPAEAIGAGPDDDRGRRRVVRAGGADQWWVRSSNGAWNALIDPRVIEDADRPSSQVSSDLGCCSSGRSEVTPLRPAPTRQARLGPTGRALRYPQLPRRTGSQPRSWSLAQCSSRPLLSDRSHSMPSPGPRRAR
jgi:hypothetical protein